jgi:hypothetical protein
MSMPVEWITCGVALKLARRMYGDNSNHSLSHPAHVAVFQHAGDGQLTLKAEALTAYFDGWAYAAGKAITNADAPMPESDVDTILRLTTSSISNFLKNIKSPKSNLLNFSYFDIFQGIFEVSEIYIDGFYDSWILNGIFFDKAEVEYLFCDDESTRQSLISANRQLGPKGVVPYSDPERRAWMQNSTENNVDAAFKQYKLDPRHDGTKQAEWRLEWTAIHGRRRGRPPKIVK